MITLTNVIKKYYPKDKEVIALDDVSLRIAEGDIFGIIGHSGAGKSTLVRLINYLEQPTAGSVVVDGKDLGKCSPRQLREMKRQIGMIFQHFNLLETRTIAHNVALPMILAKRPKAEIRERVRELLDFVGLGDRINSFPRELSGGQKQRVGIARALALNPKILLCDEATSALDPETTSSILELLKKINKELNITIVVITHEMSVVQQVCNTVAVMDKGKVAELGPTLDLFLDPQHPTSRKFVNTVVDAQVEASDLLKIADPQIGYYRLELVDDPAQQPFLETLAREYNLDVRIIKGNTLTLKTSEVVILNVRFSGTTSQRQAGIEYLESIGIRVREVA